MKSTNDDLKRCTRCNIALTILRVDGEPVCSTCKLKIKEEDENKRTAPPPQVQSDSGLSL